MKAKTYVDYCLKVTRQASLPEVAKAASALFKGLHAGFSEYSDKGYALAFPHADSPSPQMKLSVFRVFSETFEDQALLNAFVAQHPQNDVLFYAKFPQAVPGDFKGQYRSFSRLRIASRATPMKRHQKMVGVEENGNLWIDMSSQENRQRFRMYIASLDGHPAAEGKLNSYGLSLSAEPVFLPMI